MRHTLLTGGLAALLLATTASGAFAAGRTERVSVGPGGVQGDDDSGRPSVSGNGSLVAFESGASNLVPGDANDAPDIFVRDRRAGTTTRVSVASSGVAANDGSYAPLISKEGRRVAFDSFASNLVANDTNDTSDVFVRDLASGTTVRASVGPGGQQLDEYASLLAISADAQTVTFSTQKALGGDRYQNTLMTRDLKAGTTTIESRDAQGKLGDGQYFDADLSQDGRYLAFDSDSTNLVPGTSDDFNIYVRDRRMGTLQLVNVTPDGKPSKGEGLGLAISGDGSVVAFGAVGDDLVPGVGVADRLLPYARDLKTGKTAKLAVAAGGAEPDADVFISDISADGRYVAFHTAAGNILPGDLNDADDVFVHDRQTGKTVLASARPSGAFGKKGSSLLASISANGRTVAFESDATAFVPGDTNGTSDAFARELPKP